MKLSYDRSSKPRPTSFRVSFLVGSTFYWKWSTKRQEKSNKWSQVVAEVLKNEAART
jgi:hypothetical protein